MKILLVSIPFDFAGGKILLSKGINKYTKHSCRLLTTGQTYLKSETDIIFKNDDLDMLKVIDESDVLVFFMQDYTFKIGNLDWRDHLKGKRILFNGQISPWLRGNWRNDLIAKGKLFNYYENTGVQTFSFKGDEIYYKNEKWMPVYVPIHDRQYKPKVRFFDGKIIIGQSPTELDRKDTNVFVSVFKRLREKYHNIEMDILRGIDNKECLKRKRFWHIAFDSINEGHEGKSGWESLSMGIPTITGMNGSQIDALKSWNSGTQPFFVVENEEQLYFQIETFLVNREYLVKASHDSRLWMEDYCYPERVIGRFIEIIEGTEICQK